MMAKEELWYQAKIWLWSRDHDLRESERIAIGPPRRLIDDVRIDIARGTADALERYSLIHYHRRDIGAEIIWPKERQGAWLSQEQLGSFQAA